MNGVALVLLGLGEQPGAAEQALLRELKLAYVPAQEQQDLHDGFYLRAEHEGLTLYAAAARGRGGLRVDFSTPALTRRARENLRKQNFGKALGLKPDLLPAVIDGTGGFGTDAFLMASHGCRVQLWERSALVYAMLRDGRERGMKRGGVLSETLGRIDLHRGDYGAANGASAMSAATADVVYLDPMFPAANKRARSKKPMAFLQDILDGDNDEQTLLAWARQQARRRVVVKRAKSSPALANTEPDLVFRGRSNRYDVYFTG